MAATPQYANLMVRGLKSGLTRSVNAYFSDVANAPVRFDSGTGASSASNTYYTFPEDVIITDFSIVTGTADTTRTMITVDGQPTGNILPYVIHVSTLNQRPTLAVKIPAGHLLGAVQLA